MRLAPAAVRKGRIQKCEELFSTSARDIRFEDRETPMGHEYCGIVEEIGTRAKGLVPK
jgi:threonine dehydrogenase-like Zn-dependent dehydrogenase